MEVRTKEMLAENEKRRARFLEPYDPITGVGSPIPRFEFRVFQDAEPILIPESMRSLPFIEHAALNSLEEYAATTDASFEEWLEAFEDFRYDHDFEYWAYTTVKIKPKEGGDLIKFKLNRPQLRLLKDVEDRRSINKPIRVVLVKARQYGGSTFYQVYMAWIQLRHKTNWNSLIAAHINQAASNIRNMYSTLVNNYSLAEYSLTPFEGTTNIKQIAGRSNKITIGSMQNPESIRSDAVAMTHLSEVGLWKKTEGKEPEDLVQSVLGTIPNLPLSMVVLESTAKGVDNYFHRTYLEAVRGNSGFSPMFVGWQEIAMYQTEFEDHNEKLEFIASLTSDDIARWSKGATLEGLKWYRGKLAEMNGNKWRMSSEFPSDAAEAFQSTGARVFAPEYVQNMRKTCCPPEFVGEVFPVGTTGKAAFEGIEIKEIARGNASVWALPNDPPAPAGKKVLHRYALWADIGGRSHKSDPSVISVFDRYWMLEGGKPERVFTWKGHIDQDLFVWKAAQVARFYLNALFAFEVNRMSIDRQTSEGSHEYTLLDEISEYYQNLYKRTQPEKIMNSAPSSYGFHTNHSTKTMLTDNFNKILRTNGYVEKDDRAAYEADTFELKQDGSMGAVDGGHDDVIFTTFGGIWLATSYMPPPSIVDEKVKLVRPIIKSLADF
jgi:hypothetical protein